MGSRGLWRLSGDNGLGNWWQTGGSPAAVAMGDNNRWSPWPLLIRTCLAILSMWILNRTDSSGWSQAIKLHGNDKKQAQRTTITTVSVCVGFEWRWRLEWVNGDRGEL